MLWYMKVENSGLEELEYLTEGPVAEGMANLWYI